MTLGDLMWEATLIGLGLLILAGALWLLGALITQLWLMAVAYQQRKECQAWEARDHERWMNEIRKALVEDAHRATAGLVEEDVEPPIMTLTPERLDMLSKALAS